MTKDRMMIGEDEALLSVDLRYKLKALGYIITAIAASSEKALKKINEDPPDFVLLDTGN